MVPLEFEGLKDLDGKSTDQTLRYSLKVIVFDEFVEVDTEALKGYQEMFAENHEVLDADNIVLVVFVVHVKVFQSLELNACLVLELLLIPYYFDCNFLLSLVVQTFYCLPETALAQELKHFEPVPQVILQNDLVVTLLVIVAMVEYVHLLQSLFMPLNVLWRLTRRIAVTFDLFLTVLSNIIYMLIELIYFLLLVVIEHIRKILYRLLGTHWVMRQSHCR
jgi:hypothetical protein